MSKKSFSFFKFNHKIEKKLTEINFQTPTEIQTKAIPPIMRNADIRGIAQTGSGKTAAYLLPIIHKLSTTRYSTAYPNVLVLVPTRELAAQVNSHVKLFSPSPDIKSVAIFGGVKSGPQLEKVEKGSKIIVATPGRLIDLCKNYDSKLLSKIKFFVIDEADKLLDMGFHHQLQEIMNLLPPHRQNMLFSATFPKPLQKIAQKLLKRPVNIEITETSETKNDITEQLYHIKDEHKASFCFHYIVKNKIQQALIFCRTKATVDALSKYLGEKGIPSAALHSDKLQAQRTKTLNNFKTGKCKALIATDIAARGIDVADMPLVINYELPIRAEDYVHRIGRTGRAGKSGKAVSFISTPEMPMLIQIEEKTGTKIQREKKPVFKTDEIIIASPVPNINLKAKSKGIKDTLKKRPKSKAWNKNK